MESIFISPGDMITLTGRKQINAQIRVLKKEGFRFTLNTSGKPRLLCSEVEKKLTLYSEEHIVRPNWGAIDG